MLLFSADIGTSSLKAAVMDESGRTLGTFWRTYDLKVSGDRVELNADEVYGAFISAAREAFHAHPEIEGVAFDAFAPSLTLMDGEGRAVSPVFTHMDRRSRAESRRIQSLIPPEVYLARTGVLPYAGGVSATSLLWLKLHREALFRGAFKAGHFTTLLFRRLTGQWGMDGVNASMTGLFNTFSGGWSEEILSALGIPPDMLPPIREPWDAPAALSKEAARLMGARSGIPVFMGTQDVSAAQAGAGNAAPGDALMTSGSSEMLSVLCANPEPHEKYYVRRAAAPGLWQVFAIGIGGFAIEWFRKTLCADLSEEAFYNRFLPEKLFGCHVPGNVRFRPYLAGDRHSMAKKRGAFTGLTLGTTRDDLLMALVAGIQTPLTDALALLEAKGIPVRQPMKITGNLAQMEEYLEFKRGVFKGCVFERVEGSPLMGNVRLALSSLEGRRDRG